MVHPEDKLSKNNVLFTLIGLGLFAFSFVLFALVGKHPEGFMGFIAPFVMLVGIVITVYGLVTNRKRHS